MIKATESLWLPYTIRAWWFEVYLIFVSYRHSCRCMSSSQSLRLPVSPDQVLPHGVAAIHPLAGRINIRI